MRKDTLKVCASNNLQLIMIVFTGNKIAKHGRLSDCIKVQAPVFFSCTSFVSLCRPVKIYGYISKGNHPGMEIFAFLLTGLGGILNPIALRKANIVYNFGLSECNRVKMSRHTSVFQLFYLGGGGGRGGLQLSVSFQLPWIRNANT